MQEGSFRCDANVSVRPAGETKLGTRCEIKNLNSFRFLQQAIEFEARRQIELIEDGGTVVQETRLYDPDKGETRSMRTKEDAQDYRYFPDPDLPPLVIDERWIERIRSSMPELPEAMQHRFTTQYGLSAYDAAALTLSRETAHYYESAVRALGGSAKLVANWVQGEISAGLNRAELDIADSPVGPSLLAAVLHRIADGTVSSKQAKELFDDLWQRSLRNRTAAGSTVATRGREASEAQHIVDAIIEEKGLRQISDSNALEQIVDEVLAANAVIVSEFMSGKQKAFHSLVGKVMGATTGKANPAQATAILNKKLAH